VQFTGCSTRRPSTTGDYPPPAPRDISDIQDAVPRDEPPSKYGNPSSYVVLGKRYYTMPTSAGYKERGIASWYGTKFHGRRTSSGEPYDIYEMTAAHKTLPLPTYAKVTNLRNGRSVIVKVNDRGPFHHNRILDLSYVAAAKLDILADGTGLVEVEAIDPEEDDAPVSHSPAPVTQPRAEDVTLYLQVGAFRNRGNAEGLRNQLETSKIGNISVIEKPGPQGNLFKVHIGPVHSVDEIDRLVQSLLPLGISDTQIIIN